MSAGDPADPDVLAERGAVDPGLAEELPGLYLRHVTVERGSGRTPAELKERLRTLSSRFAGAQAIALRNKPIPWAYRVFYRHIGLDPDEQPTPVEALALERMMKGGFVSKNLLDDALTIAIIESGVPVRAFDADRMEPPLTIRPSGEGEETRGPARRAARGDARVRRRRSPARPALRRDRERPRGPSGDDPDAARRGRRRRGARDRRRGGPLARGRRDARGAGAVAPAPGAGNRGPPRSHPATLKTKRR